jgi:dTDP-4-dehydrorhamnose reductase
VFDGAQVGSPYVESSRVRPLNEYGRSKAAMEEKVLARHPAALIVRTSSFFGPWDSANFVTQSLHSLITKGKVTAADDQVVSPTYVPDLVNAALDLLEDRERGIWHLTNVGQVSWFELARRVADAVGLPTSGVRGRPQGELQLPAVRPAYSVLSSERGWIMPTLEDALMRYTREAEIRTPVAA